MKTIRDFDLKDKKVLVRCDFNVPLSEEGNILDDFRIRKTLPTIKYLKEKGAKLILLSHLGRPQKVQSLKTSLSSVEPSQIQSFSLKPIGLRLGQLLNEQIKFFPGCTGKELEKEIEKMKRGEIILLENLRFYKEEEENDENFAKELAKLGDIFINDALSVSHRSHASVVGITKYLSSGAGFLLENEVKVLSKIITNPKRPLVAIIGGGKVRDKAEIVERFSNFADSVLLGNLIAEEIIKKKIQNLKKIFFPVDSKENYDIGEKTIKIFKEQIIRAKTVFWAGPLGKIEEKKYQNGTREIAKAVIESQAFSVIGGGDTVEFFNEINLTEEFNYVSIGGGAMLKFLAGEKLPGLEVLK